MLLILRSMYLLKGGRQNDAIQKLQACISDIKHWSVHNCSNLMQIKLRFFILPVNLDKVINLNLLRWMKVLLIQFADSARNLGVKLDKHLTLNYYINDTCRAASFALHKNWDNTTVLKPEINRETCSCSCNVTY